MAFSIKNRLYKGKIETTLGVSSTQTASDLILEIRSPDRVVHSTDVSENEMTSARPYVHLCPLPIDDVLKTMMLTVLVRRDDDILASADMVFKHCVKDSRPIVVSNLRPEGRRIQGWVVQASGVEPRVSLFVNGVHTETTVPNTQRADIEMQYPETRSVKNGFGFGVPMTCYDGDQHDFCMIEEKDLIIAENLPRKFSVMDFQDALVRRWDVVMNKVGERLKRI